MSERPSTQGFRLNAADPDAIEFASRHPFTEADRKVVVETLTRFPRDCRSRGMFFLGVLEQVRRGAGAAAAQRIEADLALPYRVQQFSLVPHRDFYKLFFVAARTLHPSLPLASGMERIAESFYPIFAESLAGKTLALMLSKDPVTVVSRFVDAYKIACPHNTHVFEQSNDGVHRWTCRVEPCDYYPNVIQGICRGMVREVTAREPIMKVRSKTEEADAHNYVFEVRIR
ncbi:MAG: DUF2378 family protein [Polyangiales bacterium]